jgi:hypothetical protein
VLSRFAHLAPGMKNWTDGRTVLTPAARTFHERWKAGEV